MTGEAERRGSAALGMLLVLGCSSEPGHAAGTSTSTGPWEETESSSSSTTHRHDVASSTGTSTDSASSDGSSGDADPPSCLPLTPAVVLDADELAQRLPVSADPLPPDVVQTDLQAFMDDIDQAHSYRDLNGVDLDAMVATIVESAATPMTNGDFRLALAQLLSRLGDMHGRLDEPPTGSMFADFLVGDAEACVVAFEPDRSAFVDSGHPCLTAIDGASLEDWLATAERLVFQGSPQARRHAALRMLRELELLRQLRADVASADVELTLSDETGASTMQVTRPLTDDWPAYGDWPLGTTQLGTENVAYIRIPRMDDELLPELRVDLEGFRDATAWIIDVRDNGGGDRSITDLLMAHLVPTDEAPWITNVVWYRDVGQGDAALLARGLQPGNGFEGFLDAFAPCVELDYANLRGPYVHVHPRVEVDWIFEGPIFVVTDAGCASACDVFTSALATRPTVTVVGRATSGGSGASEGRTLPSTGIAYQRSTMVGYQRDGNLFDGIGVAVDVQAQPDAGYFVGATDPVLDVAFELATAAR